LREQESLRPGVSDVTREGFMGLVCFEQDMSRPELSKPFAYRKVPIKSRHMTKQDKGQKNLPLEKLTLRLQKSHEQALSNVQQRRKDRLVTVTA
jgi:hypothetical protein